VRLDRIFEPANAVNRNLREGRLSSYLKTKLATSYWDNRLRENGAYEQRFARPYAE